MFFKKKNKHNAIDLNNLPTHVGFIMDGNRRWARKRGLPTLAGHKEGAEALKRIVRRASEIGLKNLSFFCFSIENFKRSEEEVNYLLKMIGEIENWCLICLKLTISFTILGTNLCFHLKRLSAFLALKRPPKTAKRAR